MPHRRPRSSYTWGPRLNESDLEAGVSAAAKDLFDLWIGRKAKPADDHVAAAVAGQHAAPRADPIIESLLLTEAERLKVAPKDRPVLIAQAKQVVNWAFACTKEVNPRVIARFATRAAYEAIHQAVFTAVVGDMEYPRRWWAERTGWTPIVQTGSTVGYELRCDNPGGDKRYAFSGRRMLEAVSGDTADCTVSRVAPVNTHAAYHSLPATWGWALDPIRPPMSAVRYAASLVATYKGGGKLQVLAIEPGLTAAAMGLAWFLPEATIHMFAPLLGDDAAPITKADAVVVNLANARSMRLVETTVKTTKSTSRTLTRDEIDPFWRSPAHDPGHHTLDLVATALQHLADDGLLVVLGDVDSGVHHLATGVLNKVPDLHPIKVTTSGRPAQFKYTKAPWAPFGGLPATGRFVSAWQRVAP